MHDAACEIWLKKGEERRLRGGHLWIFSNEVDTNRSPIRDLPPGAPAVFREHAGRAIGSGYVNPHSLICGRLMSRDSKRLPDQAMLEERLRLALDLRERLFPGPFYRLVHGEGDGLPGLVVDRYGDVCVMQINTAGMEQLREPLVDALQAVVAPKQILLRADSGLRELEGLDSYTAWVAGDDPGQLEVEENGCHFRVPTLGGQKTGWFYDHRANRARLPDYVAGARVLDVCSYAGGWGVQALAAGAASVSCVDSSSEALDQTTLNAELNRVEERLTTIEGDAFEVLQALRTDRQKFDVVILDPPAFVKRRKDLRNGLAGYRRLNGLAMQVLEKQGILFSASCSSHVSEDALLQEALGAARHLDRSLQLVERGHQAADHPMHAAMPETRYLKCMTCRLLPAWTSP